MAISASASQRKCDAGVINRALIGQWNIIRSQRSYRRAQELSSCESATSYKEAIVRCPRTVIQQSTSSLLDSIHISSNSSLYHRPSRQSPSSSTMVCCGRNNGECVCAKEATCSCGKQPALQCSMPLFLHPHPSCNYCFQHRAAHVIT